MMPAITPELQQKGSSSDDSFSLLELLTVIAIVSILAALLLPALSLAKAYARSTVCKNHLHQMGLALLIYVHDNGGKYPYLRTLPDGNDYSYGTENDRWWWARLLPYYPLKWTNATYQCPGYKGAMTGVGNNHDPLGSYPSSCSFPGLGYLSRMRNRLPHPHYGGSVKGVLPKALSVGAD